MNLPCRWEILLISLWIQVGFVSAIHCKNGAVNHLSREDVLFLKDEQDPKCFTRTGEDFTCFFETADNRTYDLLYKVEDAHIEKRCEMSVQRTEAGTFLHILSFPDSDVLLYVDIDLGVMETNTNTSFYSWTVYVEDNWLLDPPFNVTLHQNGQAGQLQVSWLSKIPDYLKENVMYRIRNSSNGLGEETKGAKEVHTLDSLVQGEEVMVQVSVKSNRAGHWSSWSHPVRAMVPQSADDISLICYTSDLQNITCQWNGSRYGVGDEYKLFYKMGPSEVLARTEWTECVADRNLTDLCSFYGDESGKVKVKLSGTPAPLGRTVFSEEFTLHKSIKTSPPSHLSSVLEKDKLCLKWEAPLPSLSDHLKYEVDYNIREGEARMMVFVMGPATGTCLDVPTGNRYSVKLRAKPTGSTYSGYWSDWSDVLNGVTPTNKGTLLILCSLVLMLITAVILISFSRYLSKLKQYFWPPLPNLDKVLQGFLTEINGQKLDPPKIAKQCSEESTSSVVEVMSEQEIPAFEKPSEESNQLLSSERSISSTQQVHGSPWTEVFPDYVSLNKDNIVICPKGNKYVYEQVGEVEGPGARDELFQTCHCFCSDGSVCSNPCVCADFHNHSYLPLAELADRFECKISAARGPGNIYTNFPCS